LKRLAGLTCLYCKPIQDSVSLNQFIATAVAEKVSALSTQSYLKQRASQGNKEKFLYALSKVPEVEPLNGDEK